MIDLPKLATVNSTFHLHVPFRLNGIFRTFFKAAKWNTRGNVFITPATDQNLRKWEKFHNCAIAVVESLKEANLSLDIHIPVVYALTDTNAFPLVGGFVDAARHTGWTESQISTVTTLATSKGYDHLNWVLGVFCLEPSRRSRR
jgi:hypothetical protein